MLIFTQNPEAIINDCHTGHFHGLESIDTFDHAVDRDVGMLTIGYQ